ncbi:MAG: DUF711 family protein [Planctomycetota bacterium]
MRSALARLGPGASMQAVADRSSASSFKIARVGELVGREAVRRLGTAFGIVDVSLAPTPAIGDGVADILKLIGVDKSVAPGTTAALALLTDAVKEGGGAGNCRSAWPPRRAASSQAPMEDQGMVDAVAKGALTLATRARRR